jgi:amidophosphoribosyltransferase
MCGIFGIYSYCEKNLGEIVYLGLYALQHRGQEGAGIATYNGKGITIFKKLGLVQEVFTKDIIQQCFGNVAIAHTRYSTTGSYTPINTQPIVEKINNTYVALAHNGNLTNAMELRTNLENKGVNFSTTMDSEIFLHLLKSYKEISPESIATAFSQVKGSYSLVMIVDDRLYGIRDRLGFKPLILGKLDDNFVLCSETSSLDYIQGKYIREVEPGEIVEIKNGEVRSYYFDKREDFLAQCIFEFVYFARPDSYIFGRNVNEVRIEFGRQLAREHYVDADVVIDIPDSGTSAALGYAQESGIPYQRGFVRSHYMGRTFITPFQISREYNLRLKLNVIKSVIEGKRVVVVDDSIVRGNTAKFRVSQLREAGAKEVHYRIASPPIIYPCFFGIDFPTKNELIAANLSIPQIEKEINVDSLRYLSIQGMLKVVGGEKKFCYACFSGYYKVEPPNFFTKNILEK